MKAQVLSQMHLKNWRSVRDATIDFAPITVFIGANSSGKTNILDALHFMRYAAQKDGLQAAYAWGGSNQIRTSGLELQEAVEITLIFDSGNSAYEKIVFQPLEIPGVVRNSFTHDPYVRRLLSERFQLLRENFMPSSVLPSEDVKNFDLYILDSVARSTVFTLDAMKQISPKSYEQLTQDLAWLLDHIDELHTSREERETRFAIKAKAFPHGDAPTISVGMARMVAMLTAYYALDMRDADQPGLVVIEEPDTAIHPMLLRRFVEQLRNYVDPEASGGHRRQFILTTHNPMFLNAFEPDEVRLVERDPESGWTTVNMIDPELARVALEQDGAYNLGNLWTTRLMGAVPEW